jgi:hypothetical protein
MTRKLKAGSFVSLDGVIENPTKISRSCRWRGTRR